MTDPDHLKEALGAASDAFNHGLGAPTFEPGIDSSSEADEGTVFLQKGCRLIESAEYTLKRTEYYTSVVEHSFAAIERTFEGYLILVAGDDPGDLRDHPTVYRRAQEQVPLERATIGDRTPLRPTPDEHLLRYLGCDRRPSPSATHTRQHRSRSRDRFHSGSRGALQL